MTTLALLFVSFPNIDVAASLAAAIAEVRLMRARAWSTQYAGARFAGRRTYRVRNLTRPKVPCSGSRSCYEVDCVGVSLVACHGCCSPTWGGEVYPIVFQEGSRVSPLWYYGAAWAFFDLSSLELAEVSRWSGSLISSDKGGS